MENEPRITVEFSGLYPIADPIATTEGKLRGTPVEIASQLEQLHKVGIRFNTGSVAIEGDSVLIEHLFDSLRGKISESERPGA